MHLLPRWLEIVLLVLSVVMFAGSLLAIPVALVRIPADFFVRPRARHALGVRVLRNVLGAVLVLLGVAMLVLPGQGMLTILVGIGVLDMPWKRRVVRRILCNARVKHAVDDLREKAGKPSLEIPLAA
jgi:hypothetical protein